MLPKSRRLNSGEVESVMKKGRRSSASPFFSLSFLPASASKFAVIIPKKIAKTSVLRHKHKRRIMSVLSRLELPKYEAIIMLRKDISTLTFPELRQEIETLLQ